MKTRSLAFMVLVAGLLAGCSGGSEGGSETAAPPTTSTGKAPPDVPGKTVHKMPPLAGPNAGKGPGADTGP